MRDKLRRILAGRKAVGVFLLLFSFSGCKGNDGEEAKRAAAEQELQQLREANQELQRLRVENQDLARLRREYEELKRLKGPTEELGKLRRENDQLRTELQLLKAPKPKP